MKLSLVFDATLELPPVVTEVTDLDDAIEHMLEHESWVHSTSDPDGRCDTILMANEPMTTFYLYVELTAHKAPPMPPQVDTFYLES